MKLSTNKLFLNYENNYNNIFNGINELVESDCTIVDIAD